MSVYFKLSRALKQTLNIVVSDCIETSGVFLLPMFHSNFNKDSICMHRSWKRNWKTVFDSCTLYLLLLQKAEFDNSCIIYSSRKLVRYFSAEVAKCNKLWSVLWAVATADRTKLDLHSNPTAHAFLGEAAAWLMVGFKYGYLWYARNLLL